jgi:hypothetical protein
VRALRCTLLLAALTLRVAAPAGAATTGVVVGVGDQVDPYRAARDLRVGWVREFVGWSLAEPAQGRFNASYLKLLRTQVAAYRARGVHVEFVTVGTPAWASRFPGNGPPTHTSSYARFVGRLARAVPHVGAIEVWNEADDSQFWAHGPQPAAYTRVLRAAYKAIKRANRRITVLTTGMVANDYGFLRSLYAHHAKGSFDAVAVHTDTACLTAPPTFFYREPNGRIGRYAFTAYRALHWLMRRHGDGRKKIWMTEIGWNTGSTAPFSCVDGGRAGTKPAGVTEPRQAQLLKQAYGCLAADRYVKVAFWFNLQDIGTGPSYVDHLGLIRHDGSPKPAYAAMRSLHGGRVKPQRHCGTRVLVSKPKHKHH